MNQREERDADDQPYVLVQTPFLEILKQVPSEFAATQSVCLAHPHSGNELPLPYRLKRNSLVLKIAQTISS